MAAISVGTTATLIATGEGNGTYPSETIVTNDGGASVFIGDDATVTTSTGLTLADGSSLGVKLAAGRTIYGIVAASTNEVRVVSWE